MWDELERAPDPLGTVQNRRPTPNPALVMRIDGRWDVVAFGPYRRLVEGVSRARAEAVRDGRSS